MNHFRGHHSFPCTANVGEEKDEWDRYPKYSQYSGPLPGNRSGSNTEWDKPGSSSQTWHSEEQEPEDDPDGQPYESSEEDPELARKRKELQVIQEQIMLKRASLALKTVDLKTVNPQNCTEEARPTQSNETLRDRVKLILMQRNRMIGNKGPVAKTRRRSITFQHDHPLKHRVKVALEQRFVPDPPVEEQHFEQIAFFRAHPPPQIDTSPVEGEEKGNQGFMRFLSILNKGVDIDKLKEMVTDDTDSTPPPPLHNTQNGGEIHESSPFSSPPVEKSPVKEEQQQTPNPHIQQQRHLQHILQTLGLSLGTDEMSKLGDRTQERLYGKRQRTEEEDKEEEEDNMLDEKSETENERQAKEGDQKYSPAHYTRSSSSSSTSSSLSSRLPPMTQSPGRRRSHSSSHRRKSPSYIYRGPLSTPRRHRRSRSPHRHRNSDSPYKRRDSHSRQKRRKSNSPHRERDSSSPRRRRKSNSPHRERDSSSPRRRRKSNSPHRERDSRSPHRRQSPDQRDLRDPCHQLLPPTQPYPYPPQQYFSPYMPPQIYPDPYSQYAAYYNYWAYNQPSVPGSFDPSTQNYPQTIPPTVPSQQIDPPPDKTESSSSESILEMDDSQNTSYDRQTTRCLVTIKQMSIAKSLSKWQKIKQTQKRRQRKKRKKKKDEMKKLLANKLLPMTSSLGKGNPLKLGSDGKLMELEDEQIPCMSTLEQYPLNFPKESSGSAEANAKPEDEEKPVLTEEEIKANLKLKLEAFNSRMKKTVTQPAQILMPCKTKVEDEM